MPVPVVCPTCTTTTEVPDAAIGRILKCQNCREPVRVPSELPPPVPVEVSPAPRYGLWLFALVATVMFGVLGVFSLAVVTVFFLMIQPESPVPGTPEVNQAVVTQSPLEQAPLAELKRQQEEREAQAKRESDATNEKAETDR